MRFADRIQRKHLIVGGALAVIVCGLAFAQVRTVVPLIVFGVLISLAGQTISVAYHAYQCELFPTEVRSRASGIAYSASRAGAIMSGFIIAALLKDFGVPGVFTDHRVHARRGRRHRRVRPENQWRAARGLNR